MPTTIKIQNSALKDLVYQSLRSGLPNLKFTEKDKSIIVSDTINSCVITIDKDEVDVSEPTFSYNKQMLVYLFLLGALPINILCLLYMPVVVSIVLTILPSLIVLYIVYRKTHNAQYAAYIEHFHLVEKVQNTINKSFSKSISK